MSSTVSSPPSIQTNDIRSPGHENPIPPAAIAAATTTTTTVATANTSNQAAPIDPS